ncbi:MAG TPA: glycosyltransferase family 2 protein [Gemmataceae bacterium]|nr:glycosyltransferase family 2 protein [Gemmataceae bacterium]
MRGVPAASAYSYCPSVCVILAGHNEAEVVGSTLASVWGSYPRLQIIVVDDGSTDGMADVARRFARQHEGVLVLSRPRRSGKSSAMNFALPYVRADIVVVVDADSDLGPNAIWEIVQPMQDPTVGAVAGNVLGRNPFVNLVTWLQAYEYLSTIFIGRMLAARLNLLGIVSGAFGAFRLSALEQVKGWDVGPPEDLDLTLTLRKAGYRIAFAPYAECYTDLPTTWKGLFRQRVRWDRSGVVRNHCRKHLDLAYFWSANFHFSNLVLLAENWVFNLFCTFGIYGWLLWVLLAMPGQAGKLLLTLYLLYLVFELVQIVAVMYYSNAPGRDLLICTVFVLVPFYQFYLLTARLVAHLQEIFLRASFEDNFVPEHVRRTTWKW